MELPIVSSIFFGPFTILIPLTLSVFEYTYLLFWNVFWSLCPVIAIGLFDRIAGRSTIMLSPELSSDVLIPIDDDVLMDIPELYRYGREGYWFNLKTFLFYVLDAVYQVCQSDH